MNLDQPRSRGTWAAPVARTRPAGTDRRRGEGPVRARRIPHAVTREAATRRARRRAALYVAAFGLAIVTLATRFSPASPSTDSSALVAAVAPSMVAVGGADVERRVAPPSAEVPLPSFEGRPPVSAVGHVDIPACRFADKPAPHASLRDWASTIVDTAYALPDAYRPRDLVPVGRAGIPGGGLVRSFVINDLRALANAARANGTPLTVQSAYRSRSRQAEVFAGWVARSGEAAARQYSSRPGHSEHQLGTALDLRAAGGSAPWSVAFGSTPTGRWLAENAATFGFVVSYPAGMKAVTCYGAEAWHIRYVGRQEAAAVTASGLTLREWLWTHRGG
jgi:D-alanyl-D-alanine carboxypeptidase